MWGLHGAMWGLHARPAASCPRPSPPPRPGTTMPPNPQFKRSYKRNDKPVCIAAITFIAHLANQQVRACVPARRSCTPVRCRKLARACTCSFARSVVCLSTRAYLTPGGARAAAAGGADAAAGSALQRQRGGGHRLCQGGKQACSLLLAFCLRRLQPVCTTTARALLPRVHDEHRPSSPPSNPRSAPPRRWELCCRTWRPRGSTR